MKYLDGQISAMKMLRFPSYSVCYSAHYIFRLQYRLISASKCRLFYSFDVASKIYTIPLGKLKDWARLYHITAGEHAGFQNLKRATMSHYLKTH